MANHEKQGAVISGVVTDCCSDVPVHASSQGADPRQLACRGCREQMCPQYVSPHAKRRNHPERHHVGEVLCDWRCQRVSRAARWWVWVA